MFRVLATLTILITVACGAKPMQPKVELYSFEENNYPCVKVDFPDQIRYKDMYEEEKDDSLALIYKLVMPGYSVDVIKLYSKSAGGWSLESLSSLKSGKSKLYEIYDEENSPDKSAVVTLEEIDGEIYLKGSVALFMQSDRAIRVDILRPVKKMGSFSAKGLEKWRNSAAGNRSLENMRNIVDFIYGSLAVKECDYKESIDMEWWKN